MTPPPVSRALRETIQRTIFEKLNNKMKLRKPKSDRPFRISFLTRCLSVVAHKGNVGGWEKREQTLSYPRTVIAVGHSAGSVRDGFLFGRDRNNTVITSIVPA
jgi:hypothetical protein